MKILFFIESLRAGGKERRIVELLSGLKQYRDVSTELVLTRKDIHYSDVYNLDIPIHFAERGFLKKDPMVFFKFYRLARKIKPDIIHVWGHMVAVYAVPSARLLKIPLLNNEITDAYPNQKLLGKGIVFGASDKIISNTKAGLVAYRAPVSKSGVIYNGFNFARISNLEKSDDVRKRFDINTRFVVAMVASFLDHKDYNTYLKAAHQIVGMNRDVTFLCIGDGDDRSYKASIPESSRDTIRFLGRQSRVESIMNICDVGVLTTDIRHHGEGISNALMEFMALGKPVIATNYGGSVELIEDGVTGYLVEPFSVEQLVDRLMLLLNNTDKRTEIGARSTARIKAHFSIESMVQSFYQEYRQLLGNRKHQ